MSGDLLFIVPLLAANIWLIIEIWVRRK